MTRLSRRIHSATWHRQLGNTAFDVATQGQCSVVELARTIPTMIEQVAKENWTAVELRCIGQVQSSDLLLQADNTNCDVTVVAALQMTVSEHSVDGLDHV